MAENSPADSVVGTVICRIVGALHGGGLPSTGRSVSIASGVRMSLARQSCTALAPSVIDPPPTVTMRSAPSPRACSAAAMTALRGVCGGMRSNVPTQRLPSARRTFSISSVCWFSVPLTIRSTRCASCASSATAWAAGMPNSTCSIWLNTTRPDCSMWMSSRLTQERVQRAREERDAMPVALNSLGLGVMAGPHNSTRQDGWTSHFSIVRFSIVPTISFSVA